jgi:two-component system phosphate regulon sensor histidine kinase PhoR
MQPEPISVRVAVQEAMDDFAERSQARGINMVNETATAIVVQADPERLRQVLSNLFDNAIKYGRPGGEVRARARHLGDGRIEVTVADDGPGIPVESQPRIFERFYRADRARSREQGGTGLGLAIVKHVVQAHGGDVRVASEPGRGSAFTFTLPAAQGERR